MALGAPRHRVLWLALKDAAVVITLGALVGVPLAGLLGANLRAMLYGVTPFDPLTVVVVLGAMVSVALAASFLPARRATLVDPVAAIRVE